MAPGGYSAAVLKHNPSAKCFGITLPPEVGGHPLHIEKHKLAGLQFLDVTLLAKEYCDVPIPTSHPDPASFLPVRPFRFYKMDLIFCDGMVLRTHARASYRDTNEAMRLACAQMILALQRITLGGTIVMLLHKADSWASTIVLYTFSKFSKVQVFKPVKKHGTRSSFYMIAKDVQPEHEAAKAAVREVCLFRSGVWVMRFEILGA